MKTDQNRAKLGGRVAPMPAMLPSFPVQDWEATDLVSTSTKRTEQQAIKEGVNDPGIAAQLAPVSGRQVPMPPAGAAAFQPTSEVSYSGAKLVGNLVTGPDPKAQDIAHKQIEEIVAGTLMSGGGSPLPHAPRVAIEDWPRDEDKEFVQNAPNIGTKEQ